MGFRRWRPPATRPQHAHDHQHVIGCRGSAPAAAIPSRPASTPRRALGHSISPARSLSPIIGSQRIAPRSAISSRRPRDEHGRSAPAGPARSWAATKMPCPSCKPHAMCRCPARTRARFFSRLRTASRGSGSPPGCLRAERRLPAPPQRLSHACRNEFFLDLPVHTPCTRRLPTN